MRRVVGAFLVIAFGIVFRYAGDPLGKAPVSSSLHERTGHTTTPRTPAVDAASVPDAFRRDPLGYLFTAPIDSLCMLPGIGPVLAERVASARTGKSLFTRWEELLAVKGIGPKTLEKLKRLADE